MNLESTIRVAALLAVTWLSSRALARATAATRHRLWHTAIVAALVAPFAAGVVPRLGVFPPHTASAGAVVSPGVAEGMATSAAPLIVLAGTAAIALWMLAGWAMTGRLRRTSEEAPSEWREEARRIAESLGLHRDVPLLISPAVAGPMTVGIFRAAILLPLSAAGWGEERRVAVLVHELAHVARADCRSQALAHAALALHWFNPLMWVAVRELRRERERACDDAVLSRGVRPSAYAECLLETARSMASRLWPSAVAMARASEVEGRLLAVLSGERTRVPHPASRVLTTTGIAILAVAALGADRAVSGAAAEPAPAGPYDAALRDQDAQVRERATLALLFEPGSAAVTPLLTALADEDAQVREKAAVGLVSRRDPRVVPALIGTMRDRSAQVREKAAIALGMSGDPGAAAALEAALSDPSAQVREKAVAGLTMLRSNGLRLLGDAVITALR